MLLAGDAPILQMLREQARDIAVDRREHTGVGFFVYLAPGTASGRRIHRGRLAFGDVSVEVPGVPSGAGFVLYIEDGRLSALECYTFDEEWPAQVDRYRLFYDDPVRPGLKNLIAQMELT